MTDETPDPLATPVVTAPPATGNQVVDGVVASLAGLDDRALDEHVPAFEQAHERLRAALDGRPVMPPTPQQVPQPDDA